MLIDATARGLILLREPLVLETVLASDKYRPLITASQQNGLIFRLVYITTKSPDINVARVAQRVAQGGHAVPEDKIRKRWDQSMDNLPWFAARADRLVVADNSGQELQVIACAISAVSWSSSTATIPVALSSVGTAQHPAAGS